MLSRALLLALLAAGLSTTTPLRAWADDDDATGGWKPKFVVEVPQGKMKAAFPKGATVTGKAVLACVAGADGRLLDCKVAKEEPAGQGFGQAALSVVGYERIKTTDDAGAPVAGRPVRSRYEFLAPGDANPTWSRKPSGADLANVFPTKAIKRGVGGKAAITCDVTVEGFLQNCKVRAEAPQDLGFGAAGLQLAPQFRMTPKIRGGKAVPGGEVTIPIIWGAPNPASTYTSTPVILDPPWTRVPTDADVKAAWPQQATGLNSGQAALRCDLTSAGGLKDCRVISEIPAGKGFGKAAKTLAGSFQVAVDPATAKLTKSLTVDVPFRFRNPAAPDNRRLTAPHWTHTLTPEGMAQAFPEAATKAGVKTGSGVVTCTVTATGALSDCKAVRETPAQLDFGAAAIKTASMMRMNPWTKEGDTVDGMVITLPIDFSFEDDGAPVEASKPG